MNKSYFIVLFVVASMLMIVFGGLIAGATGTGTIEGHAFNDDDGNYVKDTETDSNGVKDTGEGGLESVPVHIFDGFTYQVEFSDANGNYSATVASGVPVEVVARPLDINLPAGYIPTTLTSHIVTVEENGTETVPNMGYGPRE